MSALHVFVAASVVVLYCLGAFTEINCMIGIITKTDYEAKPDLIIIFELRFS